MSALVIGANGQDGTFLVRHLLSKGYEVDGIGRNPSAKQLFPSAGYHYHRIDLRERDALGEFLSRVNPDCIFHVAAVHGSAGVAYEPMFHDMLLVNVSSVHTCLEYLRHHHNVRFIYASSAKVFSSPLPEVVNEKSEKRNTCLYSITKNTAHNLIEYYRQHHGIQGAAVFLFNHESELRGAEFFIPRILHTLAVAIQDSNHCTEVAGLDFFCDWGSAEEYMELMVRMLEEAPGEDFVLATGKCTKARDLVAVLFVQSGLDYRDHIHECGQFAGGSPYVVNLSKVHSFLGQIPEVSIERVCHRMLQHYQQVDAQGLAP